MTTTTIAADQHVTTLINVFTVTPEARRLLLDLLTEATERVIRHRPGFVSANLHVSLDGTRVVNYAQWRTPEDLRAMLAHPAAREHIEAAGALATAEPHLYEVASIHRA